MVKFSMTKTFVHQATEHPLAYILSSISSGVLKTLKRNPITGPKNAKNLAMP